MNPEPYDILMDRRAEEELRCPYAISKMFGGDESYDICELRGEPCLIQYSCEVYDEYLKEGE